MQSVRLKRAGAARHLLEARDFSRVRLHETAWTMLVVNRLSYSDICKANCLSNPAARWNPDELIRRIKNIHKHSDHIHLTNIDALEYIYEMYWMPESTLFIDPPYFQKGKQLYKHYYSSTDHDQLAFLLDELFKGMPGADIIVTYDMAEHIKKYMTIQTKEYYTDTIPLQIRKGVT